MCEIAVVDPDRASLGDISQDAMSMYRSNNDGIGAVAVYRGDDTFRYITYSAESPRWGDFVDFVSGYQSAWRLVIHARLGTCGGTGDKQAHPIPISCDECDVSMVVHNGMVFNQRSSRYQKKNDGHEFLTSVDTEIIGHAHGGVPKSLDDFEPPSITGQLDYLVFGDDRILVRATNRYGVSDDFRMAKSDRAGTGGVVDNDGGKWLLVTPSGVETDDITRDARSTTRVIRSGSSGSCTWRSGSDTPQDSVAAAVQTNYGAIKRVENPSPGTKSYYERKGYTVTEHLDGGDRVLNVIDKDGEMPEDPPVKEIGDEEDGEDDDYDDGRGVRDYVHGVRRKWPIGR